MQGFPFSPSDDQSPLEVAEPARLSSAAVFSSPHSGRAYPDSLIRRSPLHKTLLRSSEDAFVEELFASVPECGAPLLKAHFPRAWVDANRAADELDPALISDAPPQRLRSPRATAGLGVAPRVVGEGRRIYPGKIPYAEVRERIASCHQPYHARLAALMLRTRRRFGAALLLDCHSMPSESARQSGERGPDVVLGDRHGLAAHPELTAEATRIFVEAGFRVARNAPFAGGYITQFWGRPREGLHALQIEINRGLYLDEARVERHAGFGAFRARLAPVIARLAAMESLAALTRPQEDPEEDFRFAAE
ncbi:N-formylglutamate amidohydrolase [Neomegalonema sp.]|uniref:N-formylglutamate amidohydrolase n=1 Tax=Neomegalonema sp. TaxID=2039713 RepID=UPI00260513DC|nr:N-formylglutamate amidohydrolase [Neomegalonema sp.]MDD2868251.1 N-formylglutamate amidohydrolase [Neomegalonema sp.]